MPMINQSRELLREDCFFNVGQDRKVSEAPLKNLNRFTIPDSTLDRIIPGRDPVCMCHTLGLDVRLSNL